MAIIKANAKIKDNIIKGKPFVKWAGGKRKLLSILESQLPDDFDKQTDVTYIEPFVGGGAMLFNMLSNHPNVKRCIINDINQDLINCYILIREKHNSLINELRNIEKVFLPLSDLERKMFYLSYRDIYNLKKECKMDIVKRAAIFIFLNHTCFNGLYRVNRKGEFNVPYGYYKNPIICNEKVIIDNHKCLQKVEICYGNYSNILKYLGEGYNFVYFDPPYRPLLKTTNFKQYSSNEFGDKEQEELKTFCDELSKKGIKIMLSNSDSKNIDGSSHFESLFDGYQIGRLWAPRFINAFAIKRKHSVEVLITNYSNKKPLSFIDLK